MGSCTGAHFLRSMEELEAQVGVMGSTADNYTINGDGFVIAKGTEGTAKEAGIKQLDENGNVAFVKVGDANPDFKIGLANTLLTKTSLSIFCLTGNKGAIFTTNRPSGSPVTTAMG